MIRVSDDILAIIAAFAGWQIARMCECSRQCAHALRPGLGFWRDMRPNLARMRVGVAAWKNLDATFSVNTENLYSPNEDPWNPPWVAVHNQEDPRSAEWLVERVGVRAHHRWALMRIAIKKGYLEVAQRLYRAFLPTGDVANAQRLMKAACISGSLASIRWVEVIGGTPSMGDMAVVYGRSSMAVVRHFTNLSNPTLAFRTACAYNRLDVARWLTGQFLIYWPQDCAESKDDRLRIDAYRGWLNACQNGRIGIVRWLAQKLQLVEKLNEAQRWHTMSAAALSGDLPLLQWLACKFDMTAADVRDNGAYAVLGRMKGFAVVRWMWRRFGFTRTDARHFEMLRNACSAGDLDMVAWLIDEIGLDIGDVGNTVGHSRSPFDLADEYDATYGPPVNAPSVVSWLRQRFDIPDPSL